MFYDEMGNEVEFVVKAKFSVEDTDYVAMLPATDIHSPTYILKVGIDDQGQEFLEGIEDDELEEATEAYEELLKENLQ